MDANAWDERYRSTDLVWGVQPNRFLKAEVEVLTAKALAPGGTLLVIGHDLSNLTDGVGGPQTRPCYTPLTSSVTTSRRPAFEVEIERAERVRRPVETDDGTIDAIDCFASSPPSPPNLNPKEGASTCRPSRPPSTWT